MENTQNFSWVPFCTSFGKKLLEYEHNRPELIRKLQHAYWSLGEAMPRIGIEGKYDDIDPFTIFGFFNRKKTLENRLKVLKGIKDEFGLSEPVPTDLNGIPVIFSMKAAFSWNNENGNEYSDSLWRLFRLALKEDIEDEAEKEEFGRLLDIAYNVKGVAAKIIIALFWVNPYNFLATDSRNRWFIGRCKELQGEFSDDFSKISSHPKGSDYLRFCQKYKSILKNSNKYPCSNFSELSMKSWEVTNLVLEKYSSLEEYPNDLIDYNYIPPVDDDPREEQKIKYWCYSPGYQGEHWQEFREKGIMAINWSEIGDLKQFSSREEMRQAIIDSQNAPDSNKMNDSLATWQFANTIKIGDIICVKRGKNEVLGRGVVTSDYIFDENQPRYLRNIRYVKWQDVPENGNFPYAFPTKTLTDMTPYASYVEAFEELFGNEPRIKDAVQTYKPYDKQKFLEEVFMSEGEYDELVGLLKYKKNIILEGAPGVGKTFAAKRLAYSIIGEKNVERVKVIQFHQSYSYEDFIEGFRPQTNSNGFVICDGVFKKFCQKAKEDPDNKYFFIVDEINRGNLSKIFGELFMLIEKDKRNIELPLLYSGDMFSIPNNLYFIGMMNTADRSLAIMDYALRRRFAFFRMKPAFCASDAESSSKFFSYISSKNNQKLVDLAKKIYILNQKIEKDESLGSGFCIGHSYFCFNEEKKVTNDMVDNIIKYEVAPLLREYWFDNPEMAEGEIKKLSYDYE